jgi:imidazoleglycerol phosphate synthase glutamine amidotransferase subunit HisH
MKKLLIALTLSATLIGCSWEEAEQNAEKIAQGSAKAEQVATVLSPFTAGYGTAAATVLSGVGNIALAIAALAASKKKKAIAKAASEAADIVDGGGQALVNSAHENGVSKEILKAYEG